jgi:hypothetical protein
MTETVSLLLENGRFRGAFHDISSQLIGVGQFGIVRQATCTSDGRKYAVKEIRIAKSQTKRLINSRSEVVKLATVKNHDHIVRYYGSWFEQDLSLAGNQVAEEAQIMSDNRPMDHLYREVSLMRHVLECPVSVFIQLELCNTTLRNWLDERNKLLKNEKHECSNRIWEPYLRNWLNNTGHPAENACERIEKMATDKCLEGIVRGLHHMHRHQLAHGDLHDENVLILLEGGQVVPKLSDFGSAKTLQRLDESNTSPRRQSESSCSPSTNPYSYSESCKEDMERLADIIILLYCPGGFTKVHKEQLKKMKWKFNAITVLKAFVACFPLQSKWIEQLKEEEHCNRPLASHMLREGRNEKIFFYEPTHDETKAERDELQKVCDELRRRNAELEKSHSTDQTNASHSEMEVDQLDGLEPSSLGAGSLQ